MAAMDDDELRRACQSASTAVWRSSGCAEGSRGGNRRVRIRADARAVRSIDRGGFARRPRFNRVAYLFVRARIVLRDLTGAPACWLCFGGGTGADRLCVLGVERRASCSWYHLRQRRV